jgi:hypothetical protein
MSDKPKRVQLALRIIDRMQNDHSDGSVIAEMGSELANMIVADYDDVNGPDGPLVHDCTHVTECGFCRARESKITKQTNIINKLNARIAVLEAVKDMPKDVPPLRMDAEIPQRWEDLRG